MTDTASRENAPDGTAERLIQRLEDATPGLLFYCEADREEALEIATEEMASALASARPSPGDPVRAALEEDEKALCLRSARTFIGWPTAFKDRLDKADTNEALIACSEELAGFLMRHRAQARATLSVSSPTGEGELRQALKTTTLALAAAVSLIENGGKLAAFSNTTYRLMLDDYRKALDAGRTALAHPQQGGERDGWKLPEDVRALSDEAGVTFDSSSMIESMPQYGGGGALLGWHFSDQEEGTRKLSALIKLALRVRTLLIASPTSPSKSSGEEA